MKLGSAAFDMDDFVSKLVTFMGGRQRFEDDDGDEMEVVEEGALDWDKIGRKALAKSRRVPVTGFMYPPYSVFAPLCTDRLPGWALSRSNRRNVAQLSARKSKKSKKKNADPKK